VYPVINSPAKTPLTAKASGLRSMGGQALEGREAEEVLRSITFSFF
jgi:hypothetical protein